MLLLFCLQTKFVFFYIIIYILYNFTENQQVSNSDSSSSTASIRTVVAAPNQNHNKSNNQTISTSSLIQSPVNSTGQIGSTSSNATIFSNSKYSGIQSSYTNLIPNQNIQTQLSSPNSSNANHGTNNFRKIILNLVNKISKAFLTFLIKIIFLIHLKLIMVNFFKIMILYLIGVNMV